MKITKKASKGLKKEFNIVVSSKEIEEKRIKEEFLNWLWPLKAMTESY